MSIKKCFTEVAILVAISVTYSSGQSTKDSTPNFPTQRTYIGIGTGINYVGLIGVSAEQNLKNRISLIGTAGLGTWGYKFSAGARFYKSYPFGKGIGVSYAVATGLSKLKLNLETSSGTKQYVNMQLSPIQLINLTYFNCWKLGNGGSRFGLELGYSIQLSSGDNFKIIDSGVTLSNTSLKVLRFIQPGGLIIGMNFTFGK